MKDLLLQYTRYNRWANAKMADLLQDLPAAKLDQELKSSFPTIRKTVFHIWDAESIWLQRLQGVSVAAFPSKSLPPDTPVSRFREGSENFAAFAEQQDEAFFTAETVYKNLKGDAFRTANHGIIMHCMNHSTFHRGQLVTMLRETDLESGIPATDIIAYLRTV